MTPQSNDDKLVSLEAWTMTFEGCCEAVENEGFSRLKVENSAISILYSYRQERMNVVCIWNQAALAGISPETIDQQNKSIV